MKSILFSDTYHPTPKGHPSFLKEGKLSSGIHWDDRQILAEQLCIYSAVIGTYRNLSALIGTYRNFALRPYRIFALQTGRVFVYMFN